jgi:hypothetical protein
VLGHILLRFCLEGRGCGRNPLPDALGVHGDGHVDSRKNRGNRCIAVAEGERIEYVLGGGFQQLRGCIGWDKVGARVIRWVGTGSDA